MQRLRRWFPRALVYREFHEFRWWFAMAAALIGLLPFAMLVMFILHALLQMQSVDLETIRQGIANHIKSLLLFGLQSDNSTPSVFHVFVICGLGAFQVSTERIRGTLVFTLTGPVHRRDYLRVKYFTGVAFIFALFLLLTLVYLFVDLFGGLGIAEDILLWFVYEVMVLTAVYSAAFFAGILTSNVVAAGIIGMGICVSPFLIAGMLQVATGVSATLTIANLSPLIYETASHPPIGFLMIWLTIWSAILYAASQKLFGHIEMESFGNFFAFPVLWKLAVLAVCAVVSLIVVRVATRSKFEAFSLFTVITIILWLIAQFVFKLYYKINVERDA
jgi:ABC-type transport system involved in multi-copper enzyme maturation permease subunit